MNNTSPTWSAARIQRLIGLCNGTRTTYEMAAIMGLTRNAIVGKCSRLVWRGKLRTVGDNIRRDRRYIAIGIPDPVKAPEKPVEPPPAPPVVEKPPSLCASPGCRNTRLRGYPDGMCRDCRMELMPARTRASVWAGIPEGTQVHMPHGLRF